MSTHHMLPERETLTCHLRPEHVVVLLLGLLLVTSCSSPTSATATPTRVPTMKAIASASPTTTALAPAPQNCPSTPSPGSRVFPQAVGGFVAGSTLYGRDPVWNDFSLTPPILSLDSSGDGTKILWEVSPHYTQPVTVRVSNLHTGELAWWNRSGEGGLPTPADATQTLVLNPLSAPNQFYRGAGAYSTGWHEWGTVLSFFAAGCYAMDVSWSAGHWRIIFAVGRSHP